MNVRGCMKWAVAAVWAVLATGAAYATEATVAGDASVSKYPPAKPEALRCEPLKAA